MFRLLNNKLRRLCSRLRRCRRRSSKIQIKKLGRPNSKSRNDPVITESASSSAAVHPNSNMGSSKAETESKRIKVATFNAALFSMAPAVPESSFDFDSGFGMSKSLLEENSGKDRPIKSILKQSPLHPISDGNVNLSKQQKFAKSRLRVSINLPDNEISLLRSRKLSFGEENCDGGGGETSSRDFKTGKAPATRCRSLVELERYGGKRTVVEVLRELDADILALQEVKAEEEKEMKPLSDLAAALGMNYVFAESWAPEYGNAILSRWPIKQWKVQKIVDDSDFRNVLKATINVPNIGEVNFHCTHLDHLDETWRMKQVNAIIQSSEGPHLLAGGLNSLDETDYSKERWSDIVKYYEEMGKPTPKAEVMRFLKNKHYTDAKDSAGECESVVMIAKGQNVQGTCKYGTRVDYIVASSNSPYKFVPGSYSVLSSKGTSDHHIVKVDVVKAQTSSSLSSENHRSYRDDEQSVSRKGEGRTKHKKQVCCNVLS
ncbi:hypothetical protein LINPERPRIM_LOCUS4122 [Linum perenne]